jgi:hypothetical protein
VIGMQTMCVSMPSRDGGHILGPGHAYIQFDVLLENSVILYETPFRLQALGGGKGVSEGELLAGD